MPLLLACSKTVELPHKPEIDRFVDALSTSIYLESAYGHDPEILSNELKAAPWPDNINVLADSLLSKYGTDPELWYGIYNLILQKSHR